MLFRSDDIEPGDYSVIIRARSGDYETKTYLKNLFFNEKVINKFKTSTKEMMFKTNYYNRELPLELFVRNKMITLTNNPTIDNMFNQVFDINLNQSILSLTGSSHNVKGDYAANKEIEREIYLENIDTLSIDKKINVGSITNGPYVINLKVSDSLSKTRAWYKTEIDLKDLKPGKYTIHIRTKTGTIDDHGELYDILFKNIEKSQIVENKKYTI